MFSCGICETFKNSGGCFWKHVTYYYILKNCIGHKLAISNIVWYSIEFVVNLMMRHETWAWCGMTLRGMSKQQKRVAESKKYCWCCIILIRIDNIISRNIQNNFQNLLFKKLLAQSGSQTDIFWKICLPADTLLLPKTARQVLRSTTAWRKKKLSFKLIKWGVMETDLKRTSFK